MSLLSKSMERFIKVNKTSRTSDGQGGQHTTWEDGEEFFASARLDSSLQARVASAQGVSDNYTITTRKAVVLNFHDVIRRLKDNKVFRVTSNGEEQKTPDGAGLDMRQVTAEEWKIP